MFDFILESPISDCNRCSHVSGIGVGMFVGLIPIIISEYFDQGRSTACGVSYAGCTLASFVFPIFLQSMLDRFDLRIALAALSMISFSSLITAWPFESRPVKLVEDGEDGDEAQPENRNLVQQLRKDLDVLRLPSFWIVSVFYVVFIYVFLIFIIVLPDLAVERGLSRQSAAFLLSIHSIGDFAGRILPGYLHYTNIVRNQVGTDFQLPFQINSVAFICSNIDSNKLEASSSPIANFSVEFGLFQSSSNRSFSRFSSRRSICTACSRWPACFFS